MIEPAYDKYDETRLDYHHPRTRLHLIEEGIKHELWSAGEYNGFKSPSLVNADCPEKNNDEDHDYWDCDACQAENEFSSSSCELCSSPLAGERHAVAMIEPGTDTEPIIYSVCSDCMYYVEYGELDDMSMLEIEGEKQ